MAAQKKGYTCVLWSVDTLDWKRPSVNTVVNNAMSNIGPGSIVLMHDGQDQLPTAKAMGIIIDRLREQGYKIVTVSELLQYYEVRN
jgi:peptidoglycan/xylan/chitin deacetylase (PgdA/CDA1 family)